MWGLDAVFTKTNWVVAHGRVEVGPIHSPVITVFCLIFKYLFIGYLCNSGQCDGINGVLTCLHACCLILLVMSVV